MYSCRIEIVGDNLHHHIIFLLMSDWWNLFFKVINGFICESLFYVGWLICDLVLIIIDYHARKTYIYLCPIQAGSEIQKPMIYWTEHHS